MLGDSGYPCRRFLLTPFLNPGIPAETNYNNALCHTRVLIEQSFGVLKRRFQVLQGTIRTTPETAVNTIVACVVLHNIGIEQGDIIDFDFVIDQYEAPPRNYLNNGEDGNIMRRHVAMTYFS